MKTPRIVSIKINWLDDEGLEYYRHYTETTLKEAKELIESMIKKL